MPGVRDLLNELNVAAGGDALFEALPEGAAAGPPPVQGWRFGSGSSGRALAELDRAAGGERWASGEDPKLTEARARVRDEDTTDVRLLTSVFPVASSLISARRDADYAEARRRVQEGRPFEGDFERVARYERFREKEAEEGVLGTTVSSVLHIPAIVGEAVLAGGILRGLGIGTKAAAAERVMAGAGERLAVGAGKVAATTALMPSMYLPDASRRAVEEGGDWSDLKNLGPAYGLGVAYTAVLGQVAGKVPAVGESYVARVLAGLGEVNAVNAAAGLTGLRTDYGVVGDLLAKGEFSLKHATAEAVTFALFGAMHQGHKNPLRTMREYRDALAGLKAEGLTAAEAEPMLLNVHRRLTEALAANPSLTRAEAKALFESRRRGPLRAWGEALADTIPEDGFPVGPPKPDGFKRPESAPAPVRAPEASTESPDSVARPRPEPMTPEQAAAALERESARLESLPPNARDAGLGRPAPEAPPTESPASVGEQRTPTESPASVEPPPAETVMTPVGRLPVEVARKMGYLKDRQLSPPTQLPGEGKSTESPASVESPGAPRTAERPQATPGPSEGEIAPPRAAEQRTGPVALEGLRKRFEAEEPVTLEEVFEAAGLDARERHVVRERLKHRRLNEIAADPEVAGEGRERVTREAVRQIEKEALRKMGGAGSVAREVFKTEKTDLVLDQIEQGKTFDPGDVGLDRQEVKARSAGRRGRALSLDERMERLADQYIKEKEDAGGKLSPEREAEFRAEFARLDREGAGRPAPEDRAPEGVRGQPGGKPAEPLFSGLPLNLTFLDGLLKKGLSPVGAVKKWLREWMTAPGKFPENVFEADRAKLGLVAQYAQDVRNSEVDLRKAVGGDFGKVPEAEVRLMDDALRGDRNALAALKPEVRPIIERMRSEIDRLSEQLIESGAVRGKLVGVVEANLGVYLMRQYQVFTDPLWHQKVPEPVRNRFRSWMEAELRASGEVPTKERLDGIVKALLENGTAADNPIAFLSKSKLGSKDLAVLTRRKEVPEPLRELWGEYRDPLINYANSVAHMSHLLANHVFQERVVREGMGKYLSETPTEELHKQIAPEGSKTMGSLAGKWTTPELKAAIEEYYTPAARHGLLRGVMSVISGSKAAKTVLSHTTAIMNGLSGIFPFVANGHAFRRPGGEMRKALWALTSESPEARAYYRELVGRRVIDAGVFGGEFRQAVADVIGEKALAEFDTPGMISDRRLAAMLKQGFRGAQKFYTSMDAFWKVVFYEKELASYREVREKMGWTEEQTAKRAADVVRDTYQNYSMLSRVVRGARYNPLSESFVSFPAEMARNAYHTARYAYLELRDPRTRAIGARRLAGLVAAATLPFTIAAVSRWASDVSPEEEDAMRRHLPEWQKDSLLLHRGRDDKGNPQVTDLGRFDYYHYLKQPVIALFRGEEPDEKILNALDAVKRPVVGEQLALQPVFSALRNRRPDGSEVWNPQDSAAGKAVAFGKETLRPFTPGSVESAGRLLDSMRPESERTVGNELQAQVGLREAPVDVRKSLARKAAAFDRAQSDVARLLGQVARRQGLVSDADLQAAHAKMEDRRREVWEEMRKDVLAAERLGLDRKELLKTLRDADVSQADALDLVQGRYRPERPADDLILQLRRKGLSVEEARRRAGLIRRAAGGR